MSLLKPKRFWTRVPILLVLIILMGGTAFGATWDYYLQVGVKEIPAGAFNGFPVTNPIPNETILMWGYAQCTDATFTTCGQVAVPGPTLLANEGDTLNIHVNNALAPIPDTKTVYHYTDAGGVHNYSFITAFPSMITEPTSVIVPGQSAILTPVWVSVDQTGTVQAVTGSGSAYRPAGDVTSRIRSFNTETAVGATGNYSWPSVKAGTYIYQSGTHPAVQVQMGLYGALKVYPTATPATLVAGVATPPASGATTTARAYSDVSTAYNFDVTLLYSEVDQDLHYSIASGRYGTPPPPPPGVGLRGQITSTVNYAPTLSLVNGLSANAHPLLNGGVTTGKTLIRLLNAGLREKTPTIFNQYMNLIAEDGNLHTYTDNAGASHVYSLQQYETLLPAGKTMDCILTPIAAGTMPVVERSLSFTSGPVYMQVAAAAQNALTVTMDPTGTGFGTVMTTSSPGGINCGTGCSQSYNAGTSITLTAIPHRGSTFAGWTGGCTGTSTTCTVAMNAPTSVAATFNRLSQIGVDRAGSWYLDANGNGVWDGCTIDSCYSFGLPSDIRVTGDWSGNGKTKIGVFRNGQWYLDYNGNGTWDGCGAPADPTKDICFGWGLPGDIPVVGDWTGDGKTKVGVYRNGNWYLDVRGNGTWDPNIDTVYGWGLPGDIPVVGDWTGDYKTKIGVVRNGNWYLDLNGLGIWQGCAVDACYSFGAVSDIPTTSYWAGDGKAKIGIFRGGLWAVDIIGNGVWTPGTDVEYTFGLPGDMPVTGLW